MIEFEVRQYGNGRLLSFASICWPRLQ